MGFLRIPWGLTGALLVTTYLHSLCANASPSINVGMKASFPAAPYLLELLYLSLPKPMSMVSDILLEKLQQTRMVPPTSPSLIVSVKAISPSLPPIRSYTSNSSKSLVRMDICQTPNHFLPTSLPYRCDQPLHELKRITNIILRPHNPHWTSGRQERTSIVLYGCISTATNIVRPLWTKHTV